MTPNLETIGHRVPDADCEHENFHAEVAVNRVAKDEGGPIEGFHADVRIACADCGEPFRFIGLKGGLSWSEPRVSADGLEMCVPIQPESADSGPPDGLAGFDVRLVGGH